VIAALALSLLCASPELHVAHRKVVTEDGAALALYALSPRGGEGRGEGKPAVLILADFGFGRTLVGPLAEHLVLTGRRVFIAELRGQGAADSLHSVRTTFALDLPAVFRALSGEPSLDLIAHGYLGSIALAVVPVTVRKVVALNTPALAEPPTVLLRDFLDEGGRFSTLSASPEGFSTFEQLFVLGSRADRRSRVAALTFAARDLGKPVSAELRAWMETGDLPLDDGTTLVTRLRAYDRPTLLMLGLADGFAPTEACTPLRELAKGPVQVRLFTRVTQGDDYAHLSLFLGERARAQVFPEIEEFLK
jgi:hypothetical protein